MHQQHFFFFHQQVFLTYLCLERLNFFLDQLGSATVVIQKGTLRVFKREYSDKLCTDMEGFQTGCKINWIMCTSGICRPSVGRYYRPIWRPTLGRYIDRHSADMSAQTRSCVGRHEPTSMSADTQPILHRHSAATRLILHKQSANSTLTWSALCYRVSVLSSLLY